MPRHTSAIRPRPRRIQESTIRRNRERDRRRQRRAAAQFHANR